MYNLETYVLFFLFSFLWLVTNCYTKCVYLAQRNGTKLFAVGSASSLVSSHLPNYGTLVLCGLIKKYINFDIICHSLHLTLMSTSECILAETKVKQSHDFAVGLTYAVFSFTFKLWLWF